MLFFQENNNSVSSTSLASIASQPELEEISILNGNHTYGSIELVNGASFSAEKLNIIDLQDEIAEYRKQVKLMNDEKTQMVRRSMDFEFMSQLMIKFITDQSIKPGRGYLRYVDAEK